MWKSIKNWWYRDQIAHTKMIQERFAALESKFDEKTKELEKTKAELFATQEILADVEQEATVLRKKDEADQAKRDSKEPWVEIKSADYHEAKGIQIALDWNDAFIEYLKDSGMTAIDDDTLVQKWLANLYFELSSRMEERLIEKRGTDLPREFE